MTISPKVRIWITGASGFIWSALVSALASDTERFEIKTYSRNPPSTSIALGGFKGFYGSISKDSESFKSFLSEIDILVYLSESFTEDEALLFETQLKMARDTYDLLKTTKVKKIIYSSSIAVYWEGLKKKESDSLNPITNYGIFKILCERIFELLANRWKQVVILRLTNVYWPWSSKGVIHHFTNAAASGKPIVLEWDWLQMREFLHISDCVRAIRKAIDNDVSGIFNISDARLVSLKELIEIIKKVTGRNVLFKKSPKSENNPLMMLSEDISLAKKKLNWMPEMDIETWISTLIWQKKST